jgi:hypothetical protein
MSSDPDLHLLQAGILLVQAVAPGRILLFSGGMELGADKVLLARGQRFERRGSPRLRAPSPKGCGLDHRGS